MYIRTNSRTWPGNFNSNYFDNFLTTVNAHTCTHAKLNVTQDVDRLVSRSKNRSNVVARLLFRVALATTGSSDDTQPISLERILGFKGYASNAPNVTSSRIARARNTEQRVNRVEERKEVNVEKAPIIGIRLDEARMNREAWRNTTNSWDDQQFTLHRANANNGDLSSVVSVTVERNAITETMIGMTGAIYATKRIQRLAHARAMAWADFIAL